jgi:Type IX secretion system protein PorV
VILIYNKFVFNTLLTIYFKDKKRLIKMKKIALLLICIPFIQISHAQERVITTGVPFLMVAADARAAGLADQGVATSPDGFSQQWNPAKYAFIDKQAGFATSYTPYLTSLANDISLGQITGHYKMNEQSAFGTSLRFFSLGEINLTDEKGEPLATVKPSEFAADISYALKLSPTFSMGVAGRFISSSLKIPDVNNNANAATSFAVDVFGFYQGEETAFEDFNGRLRMGFNFQNLGPKINYDSTVSDYLSSNFLPANMKIGAGYDFAFDEYSKVTASLEMTKLLVPTPQVVVPVDTNNDGTISPQEITDATRLTNDAYKSIPWTTGIFKSFSDAPGGFSEEMREFTYSGAAEYSYQDSFALRMGYFHEDQNKGARQFYSIGAGFKYTQIKIDVSYLFNGSKVKSPLENTLRFSLTIGLGDDYGKN